MALPHIRPGIWAVAVSLSLSLSVALGTSPRLVNRVDDTCSSVLFYPSPISAGSWEGQWVAIDLSSLQFLITPDLLGQALQSLSQKYFC